MDAKDVKPHKWLWDANYPPIVLFDDGEYSAVWGKYKGDKALGVRWNTTENGNPVGYPNYGAYPMWYVEPEITTLALLREFYRLAVEDGNTDYIKNIEFAIKEFQMDDKIYDLTFEVSKVAEKGDLLRLQKEISPKLSIKIQESDALYLAFTGDTSQLLLSIAWETIKMIDGAVMGVIATEIYNYLKTNRGNGRIQINTKKEDEKLDIQLNTESPSKEDLESQIKQFADNVLNNLPKYKEFTYENEHCKKITFVYDEKLKLIVPIDYYKSLNNNLEELLKDLPDTSHLRN